VPFVALAHSPLADDGPARIFYREYGSGAHTLIILHGGWGYTIYPFDRAIDTLAHTFRIVVPDRSGYGQSGRLRTLPADFHDRAAAETFAVIDHLGIAQPAVWGHSDGAVIAAKMALDRPAALSGILLEALHYRRDKPSSRAFFEAMAHDPAVLGARAGAVLAAEHGDDYWRTLLRMNGLAWLAIATDPAPDLFGGRLRELRLPVALLHGRRDPRTEPGELDAIRAALPRAHIRILEEGGHSPHSERAVSDATVAAAADFLASLSAR
jgi:pimeloyl-ACP methyl ester carboxylesterase